MRILFLTARFPYPPHRGDRLNAHHLLGALSRRHAVTLVSFVDGDEPLAAAARLAERCAEVVTVPLSRRRSWLQASVGLFSSRPSQVSYYASATMRRTVRGLLDTRGFDAVFVQLFRMAPYVADAPHPAKVLFLTDSIALALHRQARFQPWWKRPLLAWEGARVARYEVAATAAFRESWVVSPVDARDLVGRGARRIEVVAHGVDDRLFGLDPGRPTGQRLTFLGNLSVPHNIDACRFLAHDIWPRVRRELPDACLELAGADPVPEVRALARADIEVPGTLDDLAPLWQRSTVMVAPLRFATGIQNKVLEAMAAAVPVVASPAAADGIGAVHGEHLRVAGDADEVARECIALLRDPQAARPMVARARAFVRDRFSWETQVRRLEALAARTEGGEP